MIAPWYRSRTLRWTLAGSLALHLMLLWRVPLVPAPAPGNEPPAMLSARLEPGAEAVAARPMPRLVAPKPLRRPPPPVPLAEAPPEAVAETAPAEAPAAPLAAGEPPQPVAAEAAEAVAVAEAAAEASRPAEHTAEAGQPVAPLTVAFPRHGVLEFALLLGTSQTPVGRLTYSWSATDRSYELRLEGRSSGFAGLFVDARSVQVSRGRITDRGLEPDSFEHTLTREGREPRVDVVHFEWAAKQARFPNSKDPETAPLPPGTQDPLSLMLQFAFVPVAEGRTEVAVATGRRIEHHLYELVGESFVESPAGDFRTQHLRRVQQKEGDAGAELWLSVHRPYLPVRLRFTDGKGRRSDALLDTIRTLRP
jgi:hypothetical protein